ncbi:TonB-dependent receptor [Sphingopyxis sp. MSC1_008]|jgi:iron complex outermembrane receptor protein|uniref:TonB-dependent receptor n=1 Tax=Sphingopyxis sp. MSC1_008 TaxID=2909265 RepID=UPI0020BE3F7B|nr:TonB-dependent receptor [Sphingopyxis sp. MSC1_008]
MKMVRATANLSGKLAATTALLALMSGSPVFAQELPASDAGAQDELAADGSPTDQEIIVTGTLIRGIAPTGTNVVSVNAEKIEATGAISTVDVLAKIPQISNSFNRVPVSSTGDAGTTIYKPNIRNLAASGANTTLVLVDGHRLVGAGVLSSVPDPDIVPPGVIERIEIVPDGGSSIYGSDAIGGVINIITRKRFDGVEVSGRYGFADNYKQFDINGTVGKSWDSGSVYVSYVYNENDAIFGRDRDYVRQIVPSNSCAPGTILVGSTTYALPGLVAGSVNSCDTSDNAAFIPAQQRHSVFAGLNNELSDNVSIDIRAFYTRRETQSFSDQFRASRTITAANPNFIPAFPGNASQTINFSYGPVVGASSQNSTTLNEWGVTPEMTFKLGGDWRLRVLGNYGRSVTRNIQPAVNAVAEAIALGSSNPATALNPYNVAQTPAAVLDSILNYEAYGEAEQDLFNTRAIADGSLFDLPGGAVRIAFGAEYSHEVFKRISGNHVPGDFSPLATPQGKHERDTKSLFGEIAIPVFGSDNGFTGMRSLTLSASGRYDDYSDVGSTFNPKVGLTWKPVDGVSIRGNYGESFNAPSMPDKVPQVQLQNLGGSPFVRPGESVSPGGIPTLFRPTILIAGVDPDLRPQTAKTYSIGMDIQPAFIPGLNLSATYYNIALKDQITIAFSSNTAVLFSPAYARFLTFNPTQAQIDAVPDTLPIAGASSIAALYANPLLAPYLLYDARVQNVGAVDQDGLDFSASYLTQTGFGSINANVAGTYILNRKVTAVAGQAAIDDLAANTSRLNLSATVGATIGGFSANATWYHTAGYKVQNVPNQTRVNAFNVVDLFFAYDVGGEGLFKDLAFTLNVNNVFDQDPPFINSGTGYTNGSTYGRLVQLGVRKKF